MNVIDLKKSFIVEPIETALQVIVSRMRSIEIEFDSDLDSMPNDIRFIYDALGFELASLRDCFKSVCDELKSIEDETADKDNC